MTEFINNADKKEFEVLLMLKISRHFQGKTFFLTR